MLTKTTSIPAGAIKVRSTAEGVVEGIYSATGNVDRQGDVIEAGAYLQFLREVKAGNEPMPALCWSHQWERPTGRVEQIAELLPGDSKLPSPFLEKGMGALWAQVRYNLQTQAGREAFADVSFGAVRQRSIGFDIDDDGAAVKSDRDGARHITGIYPLYELSDVLVGANPMTPALSVKEHATAVATRTRDEDRTYEAYWAVGVQLRKYIKERLDRASSSPGCAIGFNEQELTESLRAAAWSRMRRTGEVLEVAVDNVIRETPSLWPLA